MVVPAGTRTLAEASGSTRTTGEAPANTAAVEEATAEILGNRYDVIVAGARCAGASTAMLLAREGLRVLVVDPLPPDREVLSTHALMRAGVLQLHRWGLLDAVRAAGTPTIHSTVFHYGEDTVAIPIKAADGIDGLYAPRRGVLDPLLMGAARAAGAEVVFRAAVADLVRDRNGRVRGAVLEGTGLPGGSPRRRTVAAGLVIGADGLHSRVARLVDAPVLHEGSHATATLCGYWPGVAPESYHWYFRPGVTAGTIATNDGLACVFTALPSTAFDPGAHPSLEAMLVALARRVAPELARLLVRGAPVGKVRAFAGAPGFLRRSVGPGWALVGDAGYFKDPATAHGITDAFRDAELLARAAVQGTDAALAAFQDERDALVRPFMDLTDRIASLDWTLDEVRELHLALSREMQAGAEVVRALPEDLREGPSADAPHSPVAGRVPSGRRVAGAAEPGDATAGAGAPAARESASGAVDYTRALGP